MAIFDALTGGAGKARPECKVRTRLRATPDMCGCQ
jgi:hypothetical protein